jgi:hypothetical protein
VWFLASIFNSLSHQYYDAFSYFFPLPRFDAPYDSGCCDAQISHPIVIDKEIICYILTSQKTKLKAEDEIPTASAYAESLASPFIIELANESVTGESVDERTIAGIIRSEEVYGRPREGCSEIVTLSFSAPCSIDSTGPSHD